MFPRNLHYGYIIKRYENASRLNRTITFERLTLSASHCQHLIHPPFLYVCCLAQAQCRCYEVRYPMRFKTCNFWVGAFKSHNACCLNRTRIQKCAVSCCYMWQNDAVVENKRVLPVFVPSPRIILWLLMNGTGTLLMNDNCAKSFAVVIEIISSYVMAVDYHHHHYSHHSHH